jgi:hypothetical protein
LLVLKRSRQTLTLDLPQNLLHAAPEVGAELAPDEVVDAGGNGGHEKGSDQPRTQQEAGEERGPGHRGEDSFGACLHVAPELARKPAPHPDPLFQGRLSVVAPVPAVRSVASRVSAGGNVALLLI